VSQQGRSFIPNSSFSITNGKVESRGTRSDLSAVKADLTSEGLPCALLFTATDAILVPRRRRTKTAVAVAHPPLELVRMAAL
jgi:hypothetical protein